MLAKKKKLQNENFSKSCEKNSGIKFPSVVKKASVKISKSCGKKILRVWKISNKKCISVVKKKNCGQKNV